MKPLELKARLLCEGANPENEQTVQVLEGQNPQKVLRGGLSSGLKVKLSPPLKVLGSPQKELRVNFPLYLKRKVALKICAIKNGLIILENGREVGRAEVIAPPEWYGETIDGYPISSILTLHNDQLTGSVYEWCSLFNTSEQCRFCVMDKSQKYPELRNVKRKAELILKAMEAVPAGLYRGVNLNGGMTFGEGRGLEQVIPLIEAIRQRFGKLPISVETTPPTNLDFIEKFAEAGGESLMMNLETWDDEKRKNLIPGKDKYCPKEAYFRAFKKAVEVLGKGKVSTCFIVGTESVDSLKEGIKKVVEYDVIPSPLAGRCFEQFPDYPFGSMANWQDLLEIFKFTRAEMFKRNLFNADKAGCVACGMCDIVGDQM